ncbi:MAG TPA: YetF domain-containing protein [Nocardioides sp.]|nr:YetF domain-containing protein [Nocardioides sp.]
MEIVIRAAVMFLFLWGVTRAVGRSTLGELSTFELLLYVTMGDLVQQSVTQQDYSLTSGVLTISVFALFTTALSWTQWRFPRTRSLINGKPIVIIRDGLALSEALRQQRLSMADLLAAARQQGIRSVGDVDLAIFENDGRISFFTRNDDPEGAPETASAG